MEDSENIHNLLYWQALIKVYLTQKEIKGVQSNSKLAKTLIILFYTLFPNYYFDLGLKNFKKNYIDNETLIEGAKTNAESIELKGMQAMYSYIEHYDFKLQPLTIFKVLQLHRNLFSFTPFPELGGVRRDRMLS